MNERLGSGWGGGWSLQYIYIHVIDVFVVGSVQYHFREIPCSCKTWERNRHIPPATPAYSKVHMLIFRKLRFQYATSPNVFFFQWTFLLVYSSHNFEQRISTILILTNFREKLILPQLLCTSWYIGNFDYLKAKWLQSQVNQIWTSSHSVYLQILRNAIFFDIFLKLKCIIKIVCNMGKTETSFISKQSGGSASSKWVTFWASLRVWGGVGLKICCTHITAQQFLWPGTHHDHCKFIRYICENFETKKWHFPKKKNASPGRFS